MEKNKITVMVSGLNNIDSPGPGVPVIRALREASSFTPRIVGLAYENLEPGVYMPEIADVTYKVPYPSEGTDAVIERIKYIQEKEQAQVLIPNFDSELYTFMKSESILKSMGINTFMPTIKQYEERHKANLPDFGKKYNVNVPFSKPVTDVYGLKKIKSEFKFPVMVKGKFYDAYIAQDLVQAEIFFYKLAAKWGLPVIIQEFITGTEVNVVALGDGKGNVIGAVPMRKQYITDKGKAWGGITLDDPSMLQLTKHIISETKWRGGMELELIRTKDNELYLIEINPRLPAWVYLAVAAGQNLPEALVLLALNENVVPYDKYEIGKMFIRYSWDLICDLKDFEKFATTGEFYNNK